MKLYSSKLAPNPERVTMFIAEKGGLDGLEIVPVSMMDGEHRTPDYLAISPLAQVPALQLDDGRCLTESRAICAYIEGLKPEPNLMGEGFEERAFIEMWDRRIELTFFFPLANFIRHSHPALAALEKPQVPDWAASSKAKAEKAADWIDARLGEAAFIAGDRFTIADITALAALNFGRIVRFRPWETHANIARWREVVMARPAGQSLG